MLFKYEKLLSKKKLEIVNRMKAYDYISGSVFSKQEATAFTTNQMLFKNLNPSISKNKIERL